MPGDSKVRVKCLVGGKLASKTHARLHEEEWLKKANQATGHLGGMGLAWDGVFWHGDKGRVFLQEQMVKS